MRPPTASGTPKPPPAATVPRPMSWTSRNIPCTQRKILRIVAARPSRRTSLGMIRLVPKRPPPRAAALGEKHHEMFARGAIGGLCNDFTYGCGGRLSGTEARRLDRQGFQIPYRRDHAGAAAALHHDWRAERPAGAGAAWVRRIRG